MNWKQQLFSGNAESGGCVCVLREERDDDHPVQQRVHLLESVCSRSGRFAIQTETSRECYATSSANA